MADLKLTIDANFEEASKAFNELAESSESTRKKIEKFAKGFEDKEITDFIDGQKRLEIAFKGTRGEVSAMTTAAGNYERKIERLIKNGLDPKHDAVKKLRDEHDKLVVKIKDANEVQKKQEELMKGAEKAALGLFAALGAGVAAVGVATQKMAEAGDQFAKTSRIIGMTAETFQELDYAAKMSGVDNLKGSLEKLNKSVADVKSGTGSLTGYLKENDQQLLSQLKNVNSNEEAFNLLMDAIKKAPDEFTRAELAQAAFGKSGQQMILLANEGAEGIASLREEARKYGVISNEAAANSEAYLDAQSRLKSAISGVSNELTAGLLPGLTDTITKIADFIAGVDNWERILTIAGYALAGVTAGLTAFLVISKGSAVIHGVAVAFKALTAAIAANPIGAIAVVITAVLIPALIALYKNWDVVQTYLQQGIARLEYAFKWLGSVIKEGLVVAFNTVKSAAITLVDFIYGNIIRAVGNLLEVMGKLPFVGELFEAAGKKVSSLGNAIGNLAEETRKNSSEAIQAAHDEQNATEEALKAKLAGIDRAAQARRAELEERKKQIAEEQGLDAEAAEAEYERLAEQEEEKNILLEQSLKDRLALLGETEAQKETERQDQFASWLNSRLEAEKLNYEERLAFIAEQEELIKNSENLSQEERLSAEKAFSDARLKILHDEDKKKRELLESQLKAHSDLFGALSDLLTTAGKDNRKAAIAAKALSSAQAGINSYLAFTKALASADPPANYVLAGAALAAGIAQQVKILSTAIPSAETGGRFIVPNSTGVDGSLMRVNKGEEVNVTPRGQTGYDDRPMIFNLVMPDGNIIATAINKLARSGELYTLQLAGNL
jgi:hypothetical protein